MSLSPSVIKILVSFHIWIFLYSCPLLHPPRQNVFCSFRVLWSRFLHFVNQTYNSEFSLSFSHMTIFYSTNFFLPNYISIFALLKQVRYNTVYFHNTIFSSSLSKSGKSNSLDCLYQLLACSDGIAWKFRGSRYQNKIEVKLIFTFSKFIIISERCLSHRK
jgi:hypothetical protein